MIPPTGTPAHRSSAPSPAPLGSAPPSSALALIPRCGRIGRDRQAGAGGAGHGPADQGPGRRCHRSACEQHQRRGHGADRSELANTCGIDWSERRQRVTHIRHPNGRRSPEQRRDPRSTAVSESPRMQPTAWSLQAGTVRGGRQGELYGLDDLDDNQVLPGVAPTGDGCADPSLRRGASAAPGPAPDSPVIHAHMVATALDMHARFGGLGSG